MKYEPSTRVTLAADLPAHCNRRGEVATVTMITLQAIIPDDIHEVVLVRAGREHISVDALVSRTLRAAVALPLLDLTVQERADRGHWEDFDRIMSRLLDAPPVPGDERDAQ